MVITEVDGKQYKLFTHASIHKSPYNYYIGNTKLTFTLYEINDKKDKNPVAKWKPFPKSDSAFTVQGTVTIVHNITDNCQTFTIGSAHNLEKFQNYPNVFKHFLYLCHKFGGSKRTLVMDLKKRTDRTHYYQVWNVLKRMLIPYCQSFEWVDFTSSNKSHMRMCIAVMPELNQLMSDDNRLYVDVVTWDGTAGTALGFHNPGQLQTPEFCLTTSVREFRKIIQAMRAGDLFYVNLVGIYAKCLDLVPSVSMLEDEKSFFELKKKYSASKGTITKLKKQLAEAQAKAQELTDEYVSGLYSAKREILKAKVDH